MRHLALVAAFMAFGGVAPTGEVHAQRPFPSTQSANLPTTTTLNGGNLLFEISHRFQPRVSDGSSELWGLDGPVYNRFGLAYAATSKTLIGVQRSNLDDNLELYLKARVTEGEAGDGVRYAIGAMVGGAWNMDVVEIDGAEDNEFQFYAQAMLEVSEGNLSAGVVPTWIRNPRLRDVEAGSSRALGLHGQWFVGAAASLIGEWIFSDESVDAPHDSGTFGIEFKTRGHAFKIVVTNQVRMQPTQYLVGADRPFEMDELSLGFNITRILPF